jgi:hypothetical protein
MAGINQTQNEGNANMTNTEIKLTKATAEMLKALELAVHVLGHCKAETCYDEHLRQAIDTGKAGIAIAKGMGVKA